MKKAAHDSIGGANFTRGLSAGRRPVPRYPARRCPIYEVGVKPAYQGMSMNQLYDQLESEGGLKGGRGILFPTAKSTDLRTTMRAAPDHIESGKCMVAVI